MKIKALRTTFDGCPKDIAAITFPKSQTHISIDTNYEVFAVSVFRGVVFVQIINDLRTISWLPAWLFEACDPSLPSDWICNLFKGEVSMVIGPHFLAENIESYSSMVELDDSLVQKFWSRLDERKENEALE